MVLFLKIELLQQGEKCQYNMIEPFHILAEYMRTERIKADGYKEANSWCAQLHHSNYACHIPSSGTARSPRCMTAVSQDQDIS
jgi:hypothetical protein